MSLQLVHHELKYQCYDVYESLRYQIYDCHTCGFECTRRRGIDGRWLYHSDSWAIGRNINRLGGEGWIITLRDRFRPY
jgi:hypothetical protein